MQIGDKKLLAAFGAMASLALGIVLIFHASNHLGNRFFGPSKISLAPDGSVWVVSAGHLHRLKPDGQRIADIPLKSLGVFDTVSGIAAADNDTVFIAQADPSSVFRCVPSGSKCIDITPSIAKTAGAPRYALMLAANDANKQLLISDNAAHRVLLADYDGKVLDRSRQGEFYFPNQPGWLGADEAVIPDTNHHRIVRYAVKDGRLAGRLDEFATDDAEFSRAGRIWPMDAQRDGKGQWWVLNAQNGMKNADLIRFDGEGRAIGRVDLGTGSDPTAIALTDDGLLVADPVRPALLLVSFAGDDIRVADFGDAAFRQDMERIARERAFWSRVRLAAQLLCVLGPLLGILVLWRMGERLAPAASAIKRPENIEPAPVEGIYWISMKPRYVRTARIFSGMLAVLSIIAQVALFRLASHGTAPNTFRTYLFLLPYPAFTIFFIYLSVRGLPSWRLRMGTDGKKLLVDAGGDASRTDIHEFADCATDGEWLLLGKRIVGLRTPAMECFDRHEVEIYLISRMPKSSLVSRAELIRRGLQRGNAALWFAVILISIVIAIELFSLFFPGIAAELKKNLISAVAHLFGKMT